MKTLLGLTVALLLSGCMTYQENEIEAKKNLCVNFGMTWQVFKFPTKDDELDVICVNEETGERVYMEMVSETVVRPSAY